jgi:plastocyanin
VLLIASHQGGVRPHRPSRAVLRFRGRAVCRALTPGVVLLAAVFAGCGAGDRASSAHDVVNPGAPRVDAARTGTLEGVARVHGALPRAPSLHMGSDPVCLRESRGDREDDTLVVDAEGGLRNVFVYVRAGLAAYEYDRPHDPVVLEQRGCRFRPRVLGIMTGAPLELVNGDPTLHNVHAVPAVNDEFSVGQTARGTRHTRTFTEREVMVPITCDVHGWMRAYVGVLDHPFFAVTGEGGRFAIEHLPEGTYVVEAWHEVLGTQTAEVSISSDDPALTSFLFKAN